MKTIRNKNRLDVIAGEFVTLHNVKIREWHELSDDDDLDFFLRATESDPGEDNGMGERVYEISGEDSHTGNPILFFVTERQGVYGGYSITI
jgi:hypothetical protein